VFTLTRFLQVVARQYRLSEQYFGVILIILKFIHKNNVDTLDRPKTSPINNRNKVIPNNLYSFWALPN
jgi:hypothetical protein